jgi:hypothetical protein
MLYLFYGSYTKILIIFGSAQNLLFKFKHQAFLNKKEKEKVYCAALAACLDSAQVGSGALSRADCARCPPSLTRTLTGGTRPSEASPTSRHGSGELKLIAGELPSSAVRRASFPGLSCTRRPRLHPLSPILAPVATSTAGGRLGRANAGQNERVERE